MALAIPLATGQQEQEPGTRAQDSPAKTETGMAGQIEALSRLARSAKSPSEYNSIIEQCGELLDTHPANAGHVRYLSSLKAWALNRRAMQRLELSQRFAGIDNHDQAAQILAGARADVEEALENDPGKWHSWRTRAELHTLCQQYPEALRDWEKVVELRTGQPEAASAQFNRAEILYQIGEFEKALAAYETLVEETPDDWEAMTGVGLCRLELEDFSGALAVLEQVARALPGNAAALVNRGDVYQRLGQWTHAIADYRAAMDLDADPGTMRRLAWVLSTCPDESLVNGPEAVRLMHGAMAKTGETAANLDTLAAAFAASGDFGLARDIQTRVIALGASDNEEFKVRQAAYEANDRYRQASPRLPGDKN